MRVHHSLWICLLLLPLGCDKLWPGEKPAPLTAPSTVEPVAPAPSATPSALVPVDAVASAGLALKELNNRSDGISGTTVAVAGAKATLQFPTGWKATKGEVQTSVASDERARLAASAAGPDGYNGALVKQASALGLSGCDWKPAQPATLGKDHLAGQVGDGTCKRGAGNVSAAFMTAEGLVVVGAWDEGGDKDSVFGSMRSIAKAAAGTGGGSGSLLACCRGLAQNAKSAPPPQNGYMAQAAVLCESAARANNMAGVNSALARFGMKCK